MHRPRLLVLIVAAVLAGCTTPSGTPMPSGTPAPSTTIAPTSAAPATSQTQRSEGGEVTVVAVWMGPGVGAIFDVTIDTHSIDLDELDLSDSTLRNDQGQTLRARPWAAPMGGHHREGALAFEGDTAGFLAGSRWMELVLTGIGGVSERVLRWELTP